MIINIFSNFLNDNLYSIIDNLYQIKSKTFKFEQIFKHLESNRYSNINNVIFIEKKYLEGLIFKKFVQLINNSKSNNIIIPFDLEITNIQPELLNNENDLWIKHIRKTTKIISMNEIIKKFNNNYINWKKWYLSKSPFTADFEIFLSKKIFETIKIINGERKKAIFIDLDDTIWGGTLAEVKYHNLKIGGIDPLGEAFLDFQKLLKKYSETGIILGIISRNYERSAIEAINKHPEMHLKINDFAGWRINHNNKSENIIELAKEIKIGLDSIVFLDNNYYERLEVKNKIQDITIPEIDSPYNYCSVLKNVNLLSYISLTKEDLSRSKQYHQIKKSKNKYKSHSEWLKSINTQIILEKFSNLNLERYFQMFNKINQLNLSTRRLNKEIIRKISKTKNNFFLSIKQTDKYVDLGIIGIITYSKYKDSVIFKDFLFSCRALGRNAEKLVLQFIIKKIFNNKNIKKIYFNYKKTKKNLLMKTLLDELNIPDNLTISRNSYKVIMDNYIKIIDKS